MFVKNIVHTIIQRGGRHNMETSILSDVIKRFKLNSTINMPGFSSKSTKSSIPPQNPSHPSTEDHLWFC